MSEISDLNAVVDRLLAKSSEYVADEKTGEVRGKIRQCGNWVVLAHIHGDYLDESNYVLCRTFRSKRGAMAAAAEILNDSANGPLPVTFFRPM